MTRLKCDQVDKCRMHHSRQGHWPFRTHARDSLLHYTSHRSWVQISACVFMASKSGLLSLVTTAKAMVVTQKCVSQESSVRAMEDELRSLNYQSIYYRCLCPVTFGAHLVIICPISDCVHIYFSPLGASSVFFVCVFSSSSVLWFVFVLCPRVLPCRPLPLFSVASSLARCLVSLSTSFVCVYSRGDECNGSFSRPSSHLKFVILS